MRRAFTLIELLVVLAIIAMLLALLAPAMDKAVYQAELAACGARQKGIASGVTVYAGDHKRRYPYRPTRAWKPNNLSKRNVAAGPSNDDLRPRLNKYLSINGQLNDPLAPAHVDFEGSRPETTSVHTTIEVSYHLWFSWQYSHRGPEQGMYKVGDRFTLTEADGAKRTFDFLASDVDVVNLQDSIAIAGHPDRDGVLVRNVAQDSSEGGLQYTLARWEAPTVRRGPIDTNFASSDGSVKRYVEVRWDEADATAPEMTRAPVWSEGYSSGPWDLHLGL